MRATRRTFLAASASCAIPRRVGAADDVGAARALFSAGDWEAAERAFAALVAADPHNTDAAVGLARLRLAANATAEALRLASIAPENATAQAVERAARDRSALLAARVDAPPETVVPFLAVDPLPVLSVRVNGRDARFYVDTGAGNPILDPAFARELGLAVTSAGTGTFAGGKQAEVAAARVDALSIGAVVLHDVAVEVVPTRTIPFFEPRADGVLGTRTLLRFLTTIDYAGARLVLRRRRSSLPPGNAVRMWWYGDHFLMARGRVGGAPEALFFIDTGLAGGGLMPSEATIRAAHLEVNGDGGTGVNGAGQAVRVVPFVAPSIALGPVVRRNIRGLWSPEGTALTIFPFACAGIISHLFFRPGTLTFDVDAMRLIIT